MLLCLKIIKKGEVYASHNQVQMGYYILMHFNLHPIFVGGLTNRLQK